MPRVSHKSTHAASRRLARAVFLLHSAGEQLSAASHSSPDRYHRNQLNNISIGLRELCLPLSLIASNLERGGRQ